MDIIKVYEGVLNGEISKIPYGFWNSKTNKKTNASICLEYLIRIKLKWTNEDIIKNYNVSFLKKYKLKPALEHYSSAFDLLDDTFPNTFYPWKLKYVPMRYWNDASNRKKAIFWIIEKLNIKNNKDMKKKFTAKNFKKYGLGGLLSSYYNNSPYLALNEVYPNKYKPWEVCKVSRKYWSDNKNKNNATLWLINKLDLSDDELDKKLSKNIFYKNGLGCMLKTCYKDSPYLAINDLMK